MWIEVISENKVLAVQVSRVDYIRLNLSGDRSQICAITGNEVHTLFRGAEEAAMRAYKNITRSIIDGLGWIEIS